MINFLKHRSRRWRAKAFVWQIMLVRAIFMLAKWWPIKSSLLLDTCWCRKPQKAAKKSTSISGMCELKFRQVHYKNTKELEKLLQFKLISQIRCRFFIRYFRTMFNGTFTVRNSFSYFFVNNIERKFCSFL